MSSSQSDADQPPVSPGAPTGWPAKDVLWLVGMSSAFLLLLLPFSSYIASLPFIQKSWGLSNTQSGAVFSSYLVGFALASLVVIPLTDRISPHLVLLGGLALLVTGNLLFPILAQNAWSGVVLRVLAGAGHVAAYLPAIRLVSLRFSASHRGAAVGIFVSAGYAGTTLSYTLMGFLLSRSGTWQTAYLITALAATAGLLLAVPFVLSAGSTGHALSGHSTPVARGTLDLSVLRLRTVVLTTTAYALHTAELYLARLWFPLLLTAALTLQGADIKDAAVHAATLSGLMFMLGIVGVFAGGFLSDRLGRTRGAALIFSVSGMCSFAAGWLLQTPTLLIALGFLYGLSTAADSAVYSTSIIEVAPSDQVGSAQAVQSFLGFTVGALVPVLAGAILDLGGGASRWILAFSLNGLLAVAGVFALLYLRRLPGAAVMASGRR